MKIDYKSFVGKDYGKFIVLSHKKNLEGKSSNHWFEIQFKRTKNKQWISYTTLKTSNNIRDNKASKARSLKKQAAWNAKKNRLKDDIKHKFNLEDNGGNVLAIDLATFATGIALFKDKKYIASTVVRADYNEYDFRIRAHAIVTVIKSICIKNKINTVLVEDIYLGKNVKVYMELAEVRGILLGALLDLGIRYEIIPASVYRVGIGGRTYMKRDEIKMFAKAFYERHTKKIPETDDEADAFCLGYFFVNGGN